MTPERDLINRALWAFRPTTEAGKTVNELALLCERLLSQRTQSADDEAGVRREIDDASGTALLVWADLLQEKGEDADVCEALRDLTRQGKRPGRVGGLYRWGAERPEFGGGASWTLPAEVCSVLAMRSKDLGGKEKGRFGTLSAAMLAAARVVAGKPSCAEATTDELPQDDDPFADDQGGHPVPLDQILRDRLCDCPNRCQHPREVCCACKRLKRGRRGGGSS